MRLEKEKLRIRNTASTARMIKKGRFISSSPSRMYDDFTRRTMQVLERFPWL
jgi:hypothetical protein